MDDKPYEFDVIGFGCLESSPEMAKVYKESKNKKPKDWKKVSLWINNYGRYE